MGGVFLFFVIHWYASLFCQTFFLHRYCSHRMFELSPFWEKFFYILTVICQGPSALNPRAYAKMHNLHHQFSDRIEDPHSPVIHRNIIRLVAHTFHRYKSIVNETGRKKDDIEMPFVDKIVDLWTVRIGWGVVYFIIYCLINPPLIVHAIQPIHWFIGPIQGAIVNWCGHRYGYTNFDNKDNSKNTLIIDFLLMGELYQNNHHRYARRENFAVKWFEFDPTYPIILFFRWVGIIKGPLTSEISGGENSVS